MRFSKNHRAKTTTVDGIKFASLGEARRYQELKLLKQAHVIKDFKMQPEFELIPAYKDEYGKTVRKSKYVGDFLVYYPDGRIICEDVKGDILTPEFKQKWKQFGLNLIEGKYSEQYPNLLREIVKMTGKRAKC
ncbi:DUF1064 domain-containing protein [Methanospirillum stamsii]|uniref:DUF1064 domain-containing protein n=1 Tax=Methanospirillum stamsii TaxID=1277351 RepID=A0A2V2NB24_9EURY|nr:DUF1064 domain-containing protein [Methanospirillum stamsii]PWR74826.1 hypothetical protein DLD82_07980 [Methanospirillum stamsii]